MRLQILVAAGLLLAGRCAVLRSAAKSRLESYTFEQYTRDFSREYLAGSEEYDTRATTFQASLDRVIKINARNMQEHRSWWAGVHPFMDWTEAERRSLNGYKPSRKAGAGATQLAALQTSVGSGSRSNTSFYGAGASWEGVALRQQGSCGSCWAISAAEAVEARLPGKVKVAAQALVDCVPNPQHCGGSGGCDGATGELAYTFMRDHGLPLESSYAYTAQTGSCPLNPLTGPFPAEKRARVSGWTALPSNKAEPLMQALYNEGPVVVAVDANEWFDYDQGVFDGCKKDATLGHAVLAKGYGGEGNAQYWRIQNSWGANWGEQGHIRLKRQDAAAEEAYCGQDRKPQEGLGCDGGPPEMTVCGMCGILFDPIYPTGVTLEGGDAGASAADAQNAAAALRKYESFKPEDFTMPDFPSTKVEDYEKEEMPDLWEQPKKEESASPATPPAEPVAFHPSEPEIFRPAEPAAKVRKDMEKNAVDEMKTMLLRGQI